MKKTTLLLTVIAALGATGCNGQTDGRDPPSNTARTEVPDEIVGAWENGSIDFNLWENYREGYYANRNSSPTREAMIFYKNGNAKFYRYEHAFPIYEELIDCDGTVTFNGDGTFTFYPVKGRKRFHSFQHPDDNTDRALTSEELAAPKLAGKRNYVYDASSASPVLRITVPSSAPYNWYKKQ